MRFSLLTIFLTTILSTLITAQTIQSEMAQLPACGAACLATAITASGCGTTDYSCQCGRGNAALLASAGPCVLSKCSSAEVTASTNIVKEVCVLAASMPAAASSSTGPSAAASASATSSNASATSSGTSTASGSLQTTNAAGRKEVAGLVAGAALVVALVL